MSTTETIGTNGNLSAQLHAELEERRLLAADDYLALVRRAADGEQIDAGEAAAILEDAKKTPEQFEADVKLIAERRRLVTDLANEPSDVELQKLAVAEKATEQRLAEAMQVAAAERESHRLRRHALDSRASKSMRSRQRLTQTCIDERLLSREAQLSRQRRRLAEQAETLRREAAEQHNYVRSSGGVAAHSTLYARLLSLRSALQAAEHGNIRDREAAGKKLAAEILDVENKITAVNQQREQVVAQLAAIDAEAAAVSKRKLEP